MTGLLEWAGVTPSRRRYRSAVVRLVEDLTARPGEWLAVDTYPADRAKTAWSRGSQTCKRHPELEYKVETDAAGSAHLYFRAREA